MMQDMGRKSEMGMQPTDKKEVKISYPGFSMNDNQIPKEIADMKVGDICRCEVILKKIGDDIDTYDNNKPRVKVEIHKLGYLAKAGKMSKDEYINASDEDREKNGRENLSEDKKEDEGATE